MVKNLIISCILIILLISCQKIKNSFNVLFWQNKNLVLPNNLKQSFFYLKDSLDKQDSKQYYILTLIDGSCSQCIIELKQWEVFAKQIPKNEVTIIVIIENTNGLFLDDYLNDFDLKYYFDNNSFFSNKNNLPNNKLLHTFLVDEDQKIKLIGNPIYSTELKKLYLETIQVLY